MAKKMTLPTELTLDNSKFIKGTADAKESVSGFSSVITGAAMGAVSSITTSLIHLTAEMARFALQTVGDSVKAASAFQEMDNKFNVVFRGMTNEAIIWREVLTTSYAMSSREATQFLASVQDLLVPMGMNREAAGAMSFEYVKLAADIGSFNDLPTADVLSDLMSATMGNFEAVRKYGIALNETNVKQKAAAMGYTVTSKALDPLIKAQVAYQLITRMSADAQGDMARSSDSYANTLKDLKARGEDLLAVFGEAMLPVFSELFQKTTDLARDAMPAFKKAGEDLALIFDYVVTKSIESVTAWQQWTEMRDRFYSQVGQAALGLKDKLVNIAKERYEGIRGWLQKEAEEHGMHFKILEEQTEKYKDYTKQTWAQIQKGLLEQQKAHNEEVKRLEEEKNAELEEIAATAGYEIADKYTEGFDQRLKGYLLKEQKQVWMDSFGEIHEIAFEGGRFIAEKNLEGWKKTMYDTATGEMVEYWTDDYGQLQEKHYTAGEWAAKKHQEAYKEELEKSKPEIIETHESIQEEVLPVYEEAGTEDAVTYVESFSNSYDVTWESEVVPVQESNYDQMEQEAYQSGQSSGQSFGEGFAAGMSQYDYQSPFDSFSDGGQYSWQQEGTYQWMGHTYYNNGQEFGYMDWRNGLPYWESAPQEFYDWLATQQQAFTGGFFDAIGDFLPQFARGGFMAVLHPEEAVIPSEKSGHSYKGLVTDSQGNVKNTGGSIGRDMHIHFHGFMITDDAVREATKIVSKKQKEMLDRGEISASNFTGQGGRITDGRVRAR